MHRRFEITNDTPIPKTKTELRSLLSQNQAVPFHVKGFYLGHIVPNLENWLDTAEDMEESKITEVLKYNNFHWEPQFVADSRIPFHDERWPYRFRNNAQLALRLCFMEFTFSVVSDLFTIHEGIHVNGSSKDLYHKQLLQELQPWHLVDNYNNELDNLYPGMRKKCSVDHY